MYTVGSAPPPAGGRQLSRSSSGITKDDHWLVPGLLAMGFLTALFGCRDREEPSRIEGPAEYEQADIFRDLRDQILTLEPGSLGTTADSPEPLAVLMETGYPEAVATLVCVTDGSASLYFSNGGGMIGGGEHEAVNAAAKSFLASSRSFRESFEPTTDYPLPDKGSVRFYMVTGSGVVAARQVAEDDLGNMRDELSPLFHQGHEVITAIRAHAPE